MMDRPHLPTPPPPPASATADRERALSRALAEAELPVSTPTGRRPTLLLDLSEDELTDLLAAWGEPAYRARQLFRGLHHRMVRDYDLLTDLPRALRDRLAREYPLGMATIVDDLRSSDGTRKLLLRLYDGEEVETVDIPSADRRTICISTRWGCALGCVFCATGQAGFSRQLSAGEIVDQVYQFARGGGRPITNVVFMGMGEPLANYAATVKAIRLLNHPNGMHLGQRHITVSTAGLVPQIDRLAAERLQVNLAISLHAASDEARSAIMPINRRYPITELIAAAERYLRQTGRRVTFEYTLIAGKNDSPEEARRLAALLRGRQFHVNLIPLNPSEDRTLVAASEAAIQRFSEILSRAGVANSVRRNRGRDILAACGQLRARHIAGRRSGEAR